MSRKKKLATVSFLSDASCTVLENTVQRALGYIHQAACSGADLVVLPEEFDYYGLSAKDRKTVGEQLPGGSIWQQLSHAARQYEINIVAGLREIDGPVKYNAAVVIDKNGRHVGKYRKTHLAPGEDAEVQAGDEYPVFALDGFTIGVTICMEIHYPELFTILALQGADVIVHPTMWLDYTGQLNESLVQARAIDNQIYMVTSHFIEMPYLAGRPMGHARIVDPYGRTRADTSHSPGVAVAAVDLDQSYEYWATGRLKHTYPTLKECFFGMRRPETYEVLTRPDRENNWKIKNPVLYRKGDSNE